MGTLSEGRALQPVFAEDEEGNVSVGAEAGGMSFGRAFYEASKENFTEMLGNELFDPALGALWRGIGKGIAKMSGKAGQAAADAGKAAALPGMRKLVAQWLKQFGRNSVVGEELEEMTGRFLDVCAGLDEHGEDDSWGERVLRTVFDWDQMKAEFAAFLVPGAMGAADVALERGKIHRARKNFRQRKSEVVAEMTRAGMPAWAVSPFASAKSVEEWDEACHEFAAFCEGLGEAASVLSDIDAARNRMAPDRRPEAMAERYTKPDFLRRRFLSHLRDMHETQAVLDRFEKAETMEEVEEAKEWYDRLCRTSAPRESQRRALLDDFHRDFPDIALGYEDTQRIEKAQTRQELFDAIAGAVRVAAQMRMRNPEAGD